MTSVPPAGRSEACMPPAVVLIMGVSGSGKTTVGRAIAERLACPYVEADDLHPPANREKMARGEPLDDPDRWPWLDALRAEIEHALRHRDDGRVNLVITCSALKRRYRDRLRRADEPIALVFLDADRATLEKRLQGRGGHFFPAKLLESQLGTLETPEPEENAIVLDADAPLDHLVDTVTHRVTASMPR